jgi:hypothetical protein
MPRQGGKFRKISMLEAPVPIIKLGNGMIAGLDVTCNKN